MSGAYDQLDSLSSQADLRGGEGSGRLPEVQIVDNLRETAARLGEIVCRLDVFQLNGALVFFDWEGEMKAMTPKRFCGWINGHAVLWRRKVKDTDIAIPSMLAPEQSALILEMEPFLRGVRKLEGVNVVRCPVLRGGQLEALPWGYDADTGIYTVPGGVEYDFTLPLKDALERYEREVGGFPLADRRSYAVQLAAMLALFVRHLPGGNGLRPGFLWHANKPGSGKSVLAKVCLYTVLGHAAVAKLKKDAELDKEIEAFLRAGVPYLFLDNIRGGLNSTTIEATLTSEESTGRAMGGHETFVARNRMLLLATANHLEMNEDTVRRFLVVDLFEKGNPEERVVESPLEDGVMRRAEWRRGMLEVLWAVVRNWHEKAMPVGTRKMASFEAYAALMGGIVEAAGYESPFTKFILPDSMAPGQVEFEGLMEEVLRVMDEAEVTARDFTINQLAALARLRGLFEREVGTVEEAVRAIVKRDKVSRELAATVPDDGHLEKEQSMKFGKRLRKEVGTDKKVGGRTVEFGKREQARNSTWSVKVVG